jgi:hypothetical protein
MTRLFIAIVLAMTLVGCVLAMPQLSASDYFVTRSGSFALHLNEQRQVDSCHYSLVLKLRKDIPKPIYLLARFENPINAASPTVTNLVVQPSSDKIFIDSPNMTGFKSKHDYLVEVLIFDAPDHLSQVGSHKQYIRYDEPDFVK